MERLLAVMMIYFTEESNVLNVIINVTLRVIYAADNLAVVRVYCGVDLEHKYRQ